MKKYKNIEGSYYEEAHGGRNGVQQFFYKSREDYFIEFMGLRGNEKIADIGCGSGTFTRALAKKYPNIEMTGIDISEDAVTFAKKTAKFEKIKNANFTQGALEKIPAKDNSFDAIIASHVIEHIPSPKKALIEIRKKLRSGGTLYLTTPNYISLWPLAELVFDKAMAKKGYSLDEQHISRFNFLTIKKSVEGAGFEIEKIKTLYIFSLEGEILSQTLGKILFWFDKKLDFLPFGMIIYIKAKKKPVKKFNSNKFKSNIRNSTKKSQSQNSAKKS
ncbi:MAG: methyltransferase domain-containing protein [Candidatus Diapherotrites archaeon]|nr:methyltransferase domain-containing protein [Candidatus Diapherotrites archaeon]